MGIRRVVLHDNTTVAGNGTSTSLPTGIVPDLVGEIEHSITVILTGTGAISATVDVQWSNDTGSAGDKWSSVNGTRTISGTTSVTTQLVFTGIANNVRLVTSSLTGTGVTVKAVWVGM